MNKKHAADITKRFLQICEEVIDEGLVKNKSAFAVSVGEHQQNISLMQKGERSPTLDHIYEACEKYGYSANWLVLNIGDKRLKTADQLSIHKRLTDLEKEVEMIKRRMAKKK